MEDKGSCAASPSSQELLILHTTEAHEWATYLQNILRSSKKLRKKSILLRTAEGLHEDKFRDVRCTVLLLTWEFLVLLVGPEMQASLQRLLDASRRVVALLCGVTEEDVSGALFKDWSSWRKLYSEDEPAVYVSTILESISDSERLEGKCANTMVDLTAKTTEEVMPEEKTEVMQEIKSSVGMQNPPTQLTCLTVQPQRIMCGEQKTIYIILKQKLQDKSTPEVEFSSGNIPPKRVSTTLENNFTLSLPAPDLPAGVVYLTLHVGQSSINLGSVTYYTHMEEISRCLEKAVDPVDFICQAFSLTEKESVDRILTHSLKSKMPAGSLQVFGNGQIEETNMATYQRTEELPTLLHFAAKYGLKKLTCSLLHCPGALQAYSVMNKHGDYPNTLAEKSGFGDLRRLMDEFVISQETDKLSSHTEDSVSEEVYELMSRSLEDIKNAEDVYVSMLMLDSGPEDLYEVMNAAEENPEEAILRKFFQGKQKEDQKDALLNKNDQKREDGQSNDTEDEDPYIIKEDIYDIVETECNPAIVYRVPAPVPRPEVRPASGNMCFYNSRDRPVQQTQELETRQQSAQPAFAVPEPIYDHYAGMKTPGQRQLISLQERVKVGEITVDEAVEEFKAWQIDHGRRNSSLRFQKENIRSLRESIYRRHQQRIAAGKDVEFEISSPLPSNVNPALGAGYDFGVYEGSPRAMAPAAPTSPAASHQIQRGNWKSGSTSSTSSSGSNRLSTVSCSSGTDLDLEDTLESLPPPRPARPTGASAVETPPRVPPRVPERGAEKGSQERYMPCPTRVAPRRPSHRNSAPAIPPRYR